MSTSAITRGEKSSGLESEEPDRGNPRRNGRRRSKANETAAAQKKKKIPQRGKGVAELERLRLEERNQLVSSPIQTTNYFLTPFTTDPVPIGAPVKFPTMNPYGSTGNNGFRQTGCNPNGVVPWHYQNMNTINQLPSIRGSVCIPDLCGFCVKKKRTNDVDLCWNKSSKDVTFNTTQKERMEEREDLVMHEFFPTVGKSDNIQLRLELGLESSTAAAEVTAEAAGGDDDIFRSCLMINNSVDLSLKL